MMADNVVIEMLPCDQDAGSESELADGSHDVTDNVSPHIDNGNAI